VTLLAWLGTRFVMRGFLLSGDEVSAAFQAEAFAQGYVSAPIPARWQAIAASLAPPYVSIGADGAHWYSNYLPVNALIRSAFVLAGAADWANPVIAGLSVVAMWGVARELWPTSPWRQWLSLSFLVTSAQFLVASMTGFAMPAHLCLNLFWLWLYLRRTSWGDAVLPWLGAAALGLHNPFPHALFAAPFLVSAWRTRGWRFKIYVGVVYGAACVLWYLWMSEVRSNTVVGLGSGVFRLPSSDQIATQLMSLNLLATWQAPLVVPTVMVTLMGWRQLPPALRDAAAGVVLTLIFYLFFPYNQALGWGYRYAHAVLGSLVLLAVYGVASMAAVAGAKHTRLAVVLALGCGLTLTAVRCLQARSFTAPIAATFAAIRSAPADIVVVPTLDLWYGPIFVRNHPQLSNRPLLVAAHASTTKGPELRAACGSCTIIWLRATDLAWTGVPIQAPRLRAPSR
jgi:hypothetical protein